MPPVRRLRHLSARLLDEITSAGEDAVGAIGETGSDVVSKGSDAVGAGSDMVDAGKKAGDLVDKAQDTVKLFEQWKEEVMSWYQFYLDHKWMFQLAALFILIFLLLAFLHALWQYYQMISQCCCCTFWCGRQLIRCSASSACMCKNCMLWTGRKCEQTECLIPDKEKAHEVALQRGKVYDGCDSTWLLRCGGQRPVPTDREEAEKVRGTYYVAKVLPCVPASWTDMDAHGSKAGNHLKGSEYNALSEEQKEKFKADLRKKAKSLPKGYNHVKQEIDKALRKVGDGLGNGVQQERRKGGDVAEKDKRGNGRRRRREQRASFSSLEQV